MVNNPSSPAGAIPQQTSARSAWLILGFVFLVLSVAFSIVFQSEIEAAVYVWMNSDAYSHCFLIPPAALYLGWLRRDQIRVTSPRPLPWMAFATVPIALAWLFAERLGIMEARQLIAMTLVQLVIACVLGLRSWRALSAPLLYLYFLVPFGAFVVPALQGLVVRFTTGGLSLLNIPNLSNGVIIEIPEGTFVVHEACSGLRFLVATLAFAVLYACVVYRTPTRRVLFTIVALIVAIIGNSLRVLGTILTAHFIGNAQAVEADHVLWGWGFYVIIGTILTLSGLVFRQDDVAVSRYLILPSAPLNKGALWFVLIFSLVTGSAPRAFASYLDRISGEVGHLSLVELPALPGCSSASFDSARAEPASEIVSSISRYYECDGARFLVSVQQFFPRVGVRHLFSSIRLATTPLNWDILRQTGDFSPGKDVGRWRVTEGSVDGGYAVAATALWIGGRASGLGITARLHQALNALSRAPGLPVLVTVKYYGGNNPTRAWGTVNAFLPRTLPIIELVRHTVE